MDMQTQQTEGKEGSTNEIGLKNPHKLLLENVYDEPGVDSTSAGLFSKPEDCQCGLCVP